MPALEKHTPIAADPITVHAGRVCRTVRTRYIMSLTREEYEVLMGWNFMTDGIDRLLRWHKAEGAIHLVDTKQGYGVAFTLTIDHDTEQRRDKIADLITQHIEHCKTIEAAKAGV